MLGCICLELQLVMVYLLNRVGHGLCGCLPVRKVDMNFQASWVFEGWGLVVFIILPETHFLKPMQVISMLWLIQSV